MKTIYGRISTREGVTLPGVIVTATSNGNINTTTDDNGDFVLAVPDNESEINIYSSFLDSGKPFDTYTIPTPIPAVWNIRLALGGPVITEERTNPSKKMNWLPVYAGIGLLALLLLTRKKKRRK